MNPEKFKRNGRIFTDGHCGLIMIDESREKSHIGIGGYGFKKVSNEGALFRALVELVHRSGTPTSLALGITHTRS